jgi:hypothetical protein
LRLRFRSAGMCVAGWPGERPVRRPSRSNPSRLSRLRWGRCRHVSHAHSLGCPDCGRDEQVSGAGRRRAGPSLAARLAHGWGGASPCARKRRGCVLSDAVHPQPAFRRRFAARPRSATGCGPSSYLVGSELSCAPASGDAESLDNDKPGAHSDSEPRCWRCQSFAAPSSALYWHIGDTAIRLARVMPPRRSGSNRAGVPACHQNGPGDRCTIACSREPARQSRTIGQLSSRTQSPKLK